ncbi:hypothetical protein MMC10_001850 [Thelotrema lepadinum]|nr:hypothetical protein [Thelotrema lepadinum]
MSSYTGKCHCGEVEWSAKVAQEHVLCHCNTCKLLSGGPYTLNQIIDKNDLQITKGTVKNYTYYGDSGKPVHCYYCPNCTTHVYHHQTVLGDKIIARTGLLDVTGSHNFKPAAEIYGKAKYKWEPEIAQTFETLPPNM